MAAAAFLSVAGVASATQYPNATCPDSVTIRQVQEVTASCHPFPADTVAGVGGIIIGFDPISTGFDAYIQNTGGGPFTGIDFFTHSVNTKVAPYNFAIGDSIVVEYAAAAEFQGVSELVSPNNNFGAPNFIVRKVSAGNPLPPFFVGTTTQLKETPTNTFFEQYEGCLVRINGPLTVVRTSLTGGLGGSNGFLVVDSSTPWDSVFVDGNKLTTYAPPPLGTTIMSVQGIGSQAVRGYRILLRDGNDLGVSTPPNVADAFPITDNTLKVSFDRDVTAASATTLANYSLASFGSVNAASMITASTVLLTITNGLGHGELETVTVNGVRGSAGGLTMTTPQSRTFVNGLLTAEEVQRANPDSLSATPPCVDRSRFAGPGGQLSQGQAGARLSMAATVAARYGSVYYMADPAGGPRSGLSVFAPPGVLTLGHSYRLTAATQEFFGETQLSFIVEATDLGASAVPASLTVSVAQAALDTCDYAGALDDAEDHEGQLVRLSLVQVVQRFPTLPTNGFHVADPVAGDTIFVENLNGVLSPLVRPDIGATANIIGVLHYIAGSFRVCPRDYNDIEVVAFEGAPIYNRLLIPVDDPNGATAGLTVKLTSLGGATSLDLSSRVIRSIDGTPVDTTVVPMIVSAGAGAAELCNASCQNVTCSSLGNGLSCFTLGIGPVGNAGLFCICGTIREMPAGGAGYATTYTIEPLPGSMPELATQDDSLTVVGTQTVNVSQPGAPTNLVHLFEPIPNPVNTTTRLRFLLARESDVSLEVMEVTGRRVAQLASGRYSAGAHEIFWSPRSAAHPVPAGMYFVRLRAGNGVQVQRVLLLR